MTQRSPYIVSPVYDWALFLLPPVAAIWAGVMISGTDFSDRPFQLAGMETTWAEISLGALIHAHLVAVVFRSHANTDVFRLYRIRFVVVPIALWLIITSSMWLAVTATVVATFWDVWHSGAQTFGFARIYDRNAGVPPDVARRLDKWVNQLLYAGPILAGVTLIDHLETFDTYENLGATFFTAIPHLVDGYQKYLTWIVVAAGAVFLAYYVLAHVRLWRQGYRFSPLKMFLIVSTGMCSIYSWGFNSWGEAFFIMNLFHAVQYLGLVWAMEQKRIIRLYRVGSLRHAKAFAAVAFLGTIFAYGFGAQIVSPDLTALWAITIVVSLMHFWYDGFIWSVRKKQI